jgi:hypothetical protein
MQLMDASGYFSTTVVYSTYDVVYIYTVVQDLVNKYTSLGGVSFGGDTFTDTITVTGEYVATGDGTTGTHYLDHYGVVINSETIYLDGVAQIRDCAAGNDYDMDYDAGAINWCTANEPASGAIITADYTYYRYKVYLKANYRRLDDILDELATAYDCVWYVKEDTLYFMKRDFPDSGASITKSYIKLWEKAMSPDDYYNGVVVIGGQDANGNDLIHYTFDASRTTRRDFVHTDRTLDTMEKVQNLAKDLLIYFTFASEAQRVRTDPHIIEPEERLLVDGNVFVLKQVTYTFGDGYEHGDYICIPWSKRRSPIPTALRDRPLVEYGKRYAWGRPVQRIREDFFTSPELTQIYHIVEELRDWSPTNTATYNKYTDTFPLTFPFNFPGHRVDLRDEL